MIDLLKARPNDRRALAELKRLGFAEPRTALGNLHALTPDPHDAGLLAPLLPRLLQEMSEAPDPDMALNNLERLAAQGERAALFRLLGGHPGALHLVAAVHCHGIVESSVRQRIAPGRWSVVAERSGVERDVLPTPP